VVRKVAKRLRRYSEKQISLAYASLAGSPGGEIVLWDLRDRYVERTSLEPDGNVSKTIANEGKRFVVLDILSRVEQGELEHGRTVIDADIKPQRVGEHTETGFDVFDGSGLGQSNSPRESED
jgi:hypothetical protein